MMEDDPSDAADGTTFYVDQVLDLIQWREQDIYSKVVPPWRAEDASYGTERLRLQEEAIRPQARKVPVESEMVVATNSGNGQSQPTMGMWAQSAVLSVLRRAFPRSSSLGAGRFRTRFFEQSSHLRLQLNCKPDKSVDSEVLFARFNGRNPLDRTVEDSGEVFLGPTAGTSKIRNPAANASRELLGLGIDAVA